MTSPFLLSIYFLLLGLILLVILLFLYKLTMAIGRLDRRLEQLAGHLRDLNLYDLHPGGDEVLGDATEIEPDENSTDSTLTPPSTAPGSFRHNSKAGNRPTDTDTTPLKFESATDGALD